jgi:hypothetical protein
MMGKKIYWAGVVCIALASGIVLGKGDDWHSTERGSFKIERFWEETVGDYTCSYTIVSYRNTTSRTFESQVTIQAAVYDAQDKMVDTNERSFFAHEHGPIGPGFEGTVKIPVECSPNQAKSVSVKITKAN